ncbi:hypothetical protein LAU_0399 [Lausannevirus]|uniref:Uncharacterized protein n=1 Tax=Lausannevirus TaxID=999883 RepID=F2WLX6_9VIRU|nr:hypothetical protein LAU_0399 [Lausannevirus]AEA07249.1 hypothetical protein LAU_0399 [Lausannevirus]
MPRVHRHLCWRRNNKIFQNILSFENAVCSTHCDELNREYWILGFLSGLFERDNAVIFIESPHFASLGNVFDSLSTDRGRVKLGGLDVVVLEFRENCEKILEKKENEVADLLRQALEKLDREPKNEMKKAASRCIKDALTVLRLEKRGEAKIEMRSEEELLESERQQEISLGF